jgi:hypothetical protein
VTSYGPIRVPAVTNMSVAVDYTEQEDRTLRNTRAFSDARSPSEFRRSLDLA